MKLKVLNINQVILTLACVAVIACEDPIEWKVDSEQVKLVVEGRVTNQFVNHSVKLTQTADYFSATAPRMVEGAQVIVNDGETIYRYEELQPGIYTSEVPFAGVVGRRYSLAIELSSPLGNASSFTASSVMKPPMNVDSLYNVKQEFFAEEEEDTNDRDSVFVLGLYAQEVEAVDNSYFFDVFVNDFKETDNVPNLGYFDDEFLEDRYLEDFLFYQVDSGFETDSITVVMYSIEDEYFEFIEALVVEIEGAEPLGFSGPPANVVGNLSNGGLGYFYAASADTSYTRLGPDN